jgi:hypothetical protein
MKSILYVGATLMIGASIYGFANYKKNNHKKEFTRMYEMEKKESAVTIPGEETTSKELSKKETAAKVEVTIANEKKEIDASKEELITARKNFKVPKKINYKLFSRAPLERKYLTKEIKIEEPKAVAEPVQKDSPNEKKE